MSRGVIFDDVTDTSGNALPSISVTIYEEGTFTKATLFDARTGGNNLDNPLTTNERGIFLAYLEPGSYDISVAAPTGTFVKPGVPALDPDDVNDLNENIDDINAALELLDDTGALNALQTVGTLAELPAAADFSGDIRYVTDADSVLVSTGSVWRDRSRMVSSMSFSGVTGDGVTGDSAAISDAFDYCIANNLTLWVPPGVVHRLEQGIDKDLSGLVSDIATFGIFCDGAFKPDGLLDGIRLRNGWNNEFLIKIAGGGSGGDAENSTAFRLSGCYNDKTIIYGSNYAGELIRYDNNTALASGGDGRHTLAVFSETCGRAIRTEPLGATYNMNGFGNIVYLWDMNSQIRSTFNRTNDIHFGFVNIGMGAVSGANAGISFTSCSSVHFVAMNIGEPANPASGTRVNAASFVDCSKIKGERFFFIREPGSTASETRALSIDSCADIDISGIRLDGVRANHGILLAQNGSRTTARIKLQGHAEDCQQRVLQVAAAVTGGDHAIDFVTIDCGYDEDLVSYNVIDLSNVATRRWDVRLKCNNPNAAKDIIVPASNRINLHGDNAYTSSLDLPQGYTFGGVRVTRMTGQAAIASGAFADVTLPVKYQNVLATAEPDGNDNLAVVNYTTDADGYVTTVRVRNRGASISSTYTLQFIGCPVR